MNEIEGIKCFIDKLNPEQQREEDYFSSSNSICGVKDFSKQLFWKARSLLNFQTIIEKYHLVFSGDVLELAGGYGAVATYLKSRFQDKIRIVLSDTSLSALKNSVRWEQFFNCRIDEKWQSEAESIPVTDNSFDVVFFHAGFHHVQNPGQAIKECARVLKPGGKLFLIMEPSCPWYLSYLYQKTRGRAVVEKSFTRHQYRNLLSGYFKNLSIKYFRDYYNRESRVVLIYYFILSLFPFLSWFLPCSVVIVAQKGKLE